MSLTMIEAITITLAAIFVVWLVWYWINTLSKAKEKITQGNVLQLIGATIIVLWAVIFCFYAELLFKNIALFLGPIIVGFAIYFRGRILENREKKTAPAL